MKYYSIICKSQYLFCGCVFVLVLLGVVLNLYSGMLAGIIGGLLIFLILNEYYVIKQQLMIQKGFQKLSIDIMLIEYVNMVPYHAFIFLEIVDQQHNVIIVKPKKLAQFIQHLRRINPNIQVNNIQKMNCTQKMDKKMQLQSEIKRLK